MKKVIEYLPLLTICLIYFGFCNLHGYYKSFHVDIYAYITTSEIIMAFFPALVFFSSLASASLIQTFVGEPIFVFQEDSEQEARTPSKFKQLLTAASKSIFVWFFGLLALNYGIRWILSTWCGFQPYDFQIYNVFAWMAFLIAMMWFMAYTDRREVIRENRGILAIMIVGYIGILISAYRNLDAEKIKAGIPIHEMSFSYHNKTITTDKQLLFIGQTTGHLFLYDRKAKSTLVMKSSDVDSLVIKN